MNDKPPLVSSPIISVVVPAYNAERFLTPTLESALAQTFADWELLVVNDGSKDNTQAVAQAVAARDHRVQVLSQPNAGCGAARNFGLSKVHAAAEYVIFLDHDDIWEPTALQTLLHAAQGLPDGAGAVGAARVMQDAQAQQTLESIEKNIEDARRQAEQSNDNFASGAAQPSQTAGDTPRANSEQLMFADMVAFNHIWTMGQTLIRRSLLEAVGPLDPLCGPVDDWDLYLRLTLRGPFAATPTPVIHWRSHASNTSKNKQMMRQYEDYVRSKLLASPDLTDAQRRLAVQCFANAQRHLSASQLKWAGECLSRRQWGEAIKQTRRAVINYTRFLRGSQA